MNIIKNIVKTNRIDTKGLSYDFLETGDLYHISYEDKQINLLRGNTVDGQLSNLFLRVHQANGYAYTKLLGVNSPSVFKLIDDMAIYEGTFEGISYQVKFHMNDNQWVYEVFLSSSHSVFAELFYGFDVAIHHKNAVLNNENYTCQYIDHKVFETKDSYTLCARQNQGQPQFLEIGSYEQAIAYATDGFQFFDTSYKKTCIPKAMLDKKLASKVYQYEFAYFALQSNVFEILPHQETYKSFYGYYLPKIDGVIKSPVKPSFISTLRLETDLNEKSKHQRLINFNHQINGLEVDITKDTLYIDNAQKHIETHKNQVYSFFTKHDHHVISQIKELEVERPHGHVMISNDLLHASQHVMATTNYMFGVFASHISLGNSSFHKLLGDLRNPLNLHKISGLRFYLKKDQTYHILGMPSFYEVGVGTTKWVYALDDDRLEICSYVNIDDNQVYVTFESAQHKAYDLLCTMQIVMGDVENAYDLNVNVGKDTLTFYPPESALMHQYYKELKYQMTSNQIFEVMDEKTVFGIDAHQGLCILKFNEIHSLTLCIDATYEDSFKTLEHVSYEVADEKATKFFKNFLNNLSLKHSNLQNELDQLSTTLFWYAHNALIHYASPHGLEQYNGAAWGTRDVCQGPFELFMALQHESIAKEILLKVYQRQFIENGDFPQWFMFDRYFTIQAHESHGDIIIWPLKALAYYILQTGDVEILNEKVKYMSKHAHKFIDEVTLFHHVKHQIEAIKNSFIKDTHLPKYGGGDWDDTLQPANHDLTHQMVSGWTVALLYESFTQMAKALTSYDLSYANEIADLALLVKKDYETWIIKEGLPSGFVIFNDEIKYLLHPSDQKTGLKYRLLPYIRSMISEICEPAMIKTYEHIIHKHLKHPDGVRLMDQTVAYQGGKQTYFTRAETASNFGREIGLQYVHAHIRYIEAMLKIGHAKEAFEGFQTINPLLIHNHVKNAHLRQSNLYFSSSDAWFFDRYDAKLHFDDIKKGNIKVKGGWRLYSSGPGIYMNQVISNFLGIRFQGHDMIIDPVLPQDFDGLILEYKKENQKIKMIYHKGTHNVQLNANAIPFEVIDTPYRVGGVRIKKALLEKQKENVIEIYVP